MDTVHLVESISVASLTNCRYNTSIAECNNTPPVSQRGSFIQVPDEEKRLNKVLLFVSWFLVNV